MTEKFTNVGMAGQRCRGFTLVEVLVVVSIVCVLAVLLSGNVRSAAESAKGATSIGNLRKIGLTYNYYANEHNGMYPMYTWGIDVPRMTLGSEPNANSPVRKLFSTTSPLGGLPEGGDYLDSCDVFYSPFAIRYKKRAKGAYYKDGKAEYIGYCYYSLPSMDKSETPPRAPLLPNFYNDRILENPRSPLYSDVMKEMATDAGFNGKQCNILHLDGSVSSVPFKKINDLGSWSERVKMMVESH